MNRRRQLIGLGTTVSLALAGCIGETDETEPAQQVDDDSEQSVNETESESVADDDESGSPACSFHIELLDDPPEDAPVASATEHDLLEVSLLERMFAEATEPDADHSTARRRGGEYDQFNLEPSSTAEQEAARDALEPFPNYSNTDYPPGVYVTHGGITAAITEDCVT
ncbi:hypothetical protein [Natronolimnobius baerhuensis]|uniref:Uncharacterized protein n=1 Tax=Natronolimnobius baerhuensis TaxID=253108 RepID=A0A202ECA2_9EURY|nr:hypothetical protein [Natronolimnobius baerhuensis]OVE85893.1 hypothetical protein B2G88_03535 [Natronolimnobius baerhuensis]